MIRLNKIGFAFAGLSIKSRAALVATAGTVAVFAVFAVLASYRMRLDMQQVMGHQQVTLVTRIAAELDDKIRLTHRALIATASTIAPALMRDPQALERALQNHAAWRTLFDDVFVIDREGRVIIDLPVLKRRGIDVRDRGYFRRTLETRAPVISEPYMGRGLKEPTVMMTAPILDKDGEVVGMLAGALHPLKPNLLGKLGDARVGETGTFALFTRDRTIIVSRDKSRIMTRGPEPGVSPMFDHAVAGHEGWEESANSRGLHALFSYKPLTEVPWILVAALPVEEAYAPLAFAQGRVAGMAALLALLIAPLVWFGTRSLLAPIGVLRDTIHRIQGDPASSALVQMTRRDEIGDLASDFNRMVEDLRERTRKLSAEKELNRRIIETSPVGISIFNEDGDCISANSAVARQIGASREQLLAQNFHRIESWRRYGVYELAQRALGSDTPVSGVMRVVTTFGKEVWLGITFCTLQIDGHLHLMQMTNDLTEAKKADLALVREKTRLETILRTASDGIHILDDNGTLVEANDAFLETLGYDRAAIGHCRVEEWDAQDEWSVIRGRNKALMDSRGTAVFETRHKRRDGAIIDVEINACGIEIEGQRFIYASSRNVTERRKMQAELVELNATLEKRVAARTAELAFANTELEAFVYAVSHDLRTPLRGIDGYSTLLAEEHATALGDEGVRYLERIRKGAQRMGTLIDDLLNLSRVSRGVLARVNIDVSAMAAEIVADLQREAGARGFECAILPGIVAVADPGLMRVALENLLGNAFKYTRNVAQPRVEMGAAAVDGGVEFFIRDNGAGFDMAHAGQLFQPFKRLHSAREFEGTGIGLATVWRIVQRHGGRLRAHGEPGRGATFFVFLAGGRMQA